MTALPLPPTNKKSSLLIATYLLLAFVLLSPLCSLAQLTGATMSNPIVMGNYATGSYTYTDTRNTGSYGNDYGNASPDIFYQFTVQQNTTITISTCGSGWDTYLWLLNSSGTEVLHNDDGGPTCTGITASIGIPSIQTTLTSLSAGTYYIVAEGYSTNSGTVLLSVNLSVQAATVYSAQNLIRTWDVVKPTTDPNSLTTAVTLQQARMSTTYFDGLGRPEQTVVKQGALDIWQGAPTDLVMPVVYDEFGREAQKYLPYAAASSDGLYKTDPLTEQQSFNQSWFASQGETYFYSKTEFEASPLNRPTKTMAPGNSWVGASRGVEQKYWINTDLDAVRIWNVADGTTGSFGSYTSTATYPAGELYKNATVDEAGHQVIEFKDKEGKVILKKVQLSAGAETDGSGSGHTGWLCTYYIYDDLNQLRCVIQPEGVKALADPSTFNWDLNYSSGILLNEQCFRYEYDARGRMIVKKVPGAAPVYMVYDQRDRLVLTQDGNLRAQNKWLFTKYDQLNRPVVTGFYTDATNTGQSAMQSYLTSQNMGFYENYQTATYPLYSLNQSFPVVSFSDVLTITYYDDYSWYGWYGPDWNQKDNSYDSYFADASNTTYPYPQPLTQSTATKGMVTGVWEKNGGYLTANFYDDKGRVIQTKYYNITGGLDITTTQYSFSGQVLQTVAKHEKAGTNAQTHIVQTMNSYDDLGRLTKVEKKLRSTIGATVIAQDANWKTVSQLEYDALGQLKTKKLGTDPNNSVNPLESLTYDYNIRGWMLGMNRDYLKDKGAAGYQGKYFGFELGYDKATTTPGSGNDGQLQYNGNIYNSVWKSAGDEVRRKYNYWYDEVNRFNKADFYQDSDPASGVNWSYTEMGYGVHGFDIDNGYKMKYDDNGNILSMIQHGWKPGSPTGYVDALQYTYYDHSNKLKQVIDGYNDKDSKLGDFKYDPASKGAVDYNYDVNGNLINDYNKGIAYALTSGEGILYNYLNLPERIEFVGKGMIAYSYDAAGNKLKKTAVEYANAANNNVQTATITTYIGGFVYESKTHTPSQASDYTDQLQFISMEEGRIRPLRDANDNITSFVYDYFLKDHLGNVRMVLTEEQKTDAYPAATMETVNASTEEAIYSNISSTRKAVSEIPGYPTDNSYSDPNNSVAKVSAATGSHIIGPSMVLKVMAGDKFNVRVSSWYKANGTTPGTPVSPLSDLLAALTNNIGSLAGSKATTAELSSSGVLSPGTTQFLNDHSYSSAKPKAYLNWILFDEQFKYVSSSSGADQVGSDNSLNILGHNDLPIDKNGYLYVYVSNETPNLDVFFDNLQVTHIRGPLSEETHYYPFGLTMAGISSKAASFGEPENKKKYNGIEFEKDLELNVYDAEFRELDPQTARWWQIDPVTDGYESLSPYASMYDNPITVSDPLGNEGDDCCSGLLLGPIFNWLAPDKAQAVSDKVDGAVRTGLIATGATLNGTLHTATLGLWPNNPTQSFFGNDGMNKEEQAMYNSMANTANAFPSPLPGMGPVEPNAQLAPVNGMPVNMPAIPAVPLNERVNSSSTSSPGNKQQPTAEVKKQANQIAKQTGKNRIIINTPGKQITFDLNINGRPHAGVEPPHYSTLKRNFVNGVQKSVAGKIKGENGAVTQEQIRIIRNYLKRL